MLRTGTNQSEPIKTRISQEVDRTDIIRNFQNQSKQRTVFLNRLSGVRLSPGPPALPFEFHQVDLSAANWKCALKWCSVIKVSYFFARSSQTASTSSTAHSRCGATGGLEFSEMKDGSLSLGTRSPSALLLAFRAGVLVEPDTPADSFGPLHALRFPRLTCGFASLRLQRASLSGKSDRL